MKPSGKFSYAKHRAQAQKLVAAMTLEEKTSQILYNAPAIERLGIPAYNWWGEALHGVARAGTATVFPQAIALAAVFDEDMMLKLGEAVSTEARAKYNAKQAAHDTDIYKGLTFWTPNVNVFRDPRWGRGQETYGEDPYLISHLAISYINGLQGSDENYLKTAACAKHFAVHSGPEAVRHSFDAKATEKDLWETYLPAFEACVKQAGVEAVMGAYNRLNGEPCCASKRLLQDILREQWGFTGHVTSDFDALRDLHTGHGATETEEDSAALAMQNGCDLDAGFMYRHMISAVRKGKVSEQRLDEALVNLFTTRMKLGMFDKSGDCPYDKIDYSIVDSTQMCALNKEVSRRCPVLLKNNGVLPLAANKLKTIGVIGPNANSREALVGNYEGTASRYVTVLEGIQDYADGDVRVLYAQGCHLYKDRTSGLAQRDDRASEVEAVCAQSDVVIAVMGLDATIEGEEGDSGNEFGSGDKKNLLLPGLQPHILQLAIDSKKPVVVINLAGSALDLGKQDADVSAIVHAWYPGAQGGAAIAELLFGAANFEGRLPVTFYSDENILPDFCDYSMQNRTYRFLTQVPRYPFGYGLSYSTYNYSNAALSSASIKSGEAVEVSVTVKNTGTMDGTETVQVYVKTPSGGTLNPQLKGIKKLCLKAGESKQAVIKLDASAFEAVTSDGTKTVPSGSFAIYIGGSQPDERSRQLKGDCVFKLMLEII